VLVNGVLSFTPIGRKNVDNLDDIETMFDEVDITIVSKYDIKIVEFNIGSIIMNEIEKRRFDNHLKEYFLERLDMLSKLLHREIISFSFYVPRRLDFKIEATLKLIRNSDQS
jgi:hypothetical protein